MKKPAIKPLSKFSGPLLLAGAGKMGGAMLDGWVACGLAPKRIVVIEPQPSKAVKALARRGLKLNPKGKALEAVTPLGAYVGKATLVLSIMAGRTIGFLEKSLPPDTAIVRAMPNTPAA